MKRTHHRSLNVREIMFKRGTLRLMLGGTPRRRRRRRLNAPRGILQPIKMEVARDPNILTNPGWWDERGMWLYSIVGGYVEWKRLIRMFVLSTWIDWRSKQKYGLWKEVNQKIFGDWCKEVGTKGVWSWAYAHVVMPKGVCYGHFGRTNWLINHPMYPSQIWRQHIGVGSYQVMCWVRMLATRSHWRGNLQQILQWCKLVLVYFRFEVTNL